MNNKAKLSQASMIVTLGIVLSLVTAYVPLFSVLGLLIPVPYAIIGTLTNNKYSILSLIATFFILMFTVNPLYAVSTSVVSVLPGIIIGSAAREISKEENPNKFYPIYIGTVGVVVSSVIFFFISNAFFETNLLEDFMNIMKETINVQMSILETTGVDLASKITVDDLLSFVRNMIPTMLFLQGIIIAFIVYYLEVFILKRIRKTNLEMPKLGDFYLPGNAVMVSLMLYLFILFIDIIGVKLHTGLIMVNVQMVFNFMFIIQGIAVSIYYLKTWMKKNESKKLFIAGFVLYLSGFMGISFLGMFDCIADFRKVRSYKSV